MFAPSLLESLKSANLLPSAIIPTNFNPIIDLGVTFPSGLAPHHGSLARVSQVKEQPKISISNPPPTSSNLTYTFMMIDPDAPTPDDPKFGYWRHWVVTSIPSSSATASPDDITASGTTLTQYLAPGPKDESGPHRYLFLLFEEKEGIALEKMDVGGEEFVDRRSFRAEEVVERKGMKLVGVQWMRGVGDGWKESKGEL
ncbi:Phospholipid-binding protein [Pyrenophora tritici-repentis]|nr:Phospholipid-binding protein [Pyrenophora tritici-repentis]KAI0605446.1 Phospholipid-binding protein [Pyrenophora tritici-repentis]KAI2478380.1 Phospholipid-binding protein [Pyrenophora tritici-repentis]